MKIYKWVAKTLVDMVCHHHKTRRSQHLSNIKKCKECGALLTNNGEV